MSSPSVPVRVVPTNKASQLFEDSRRQNKQPEHPSRKIRVLCLHGQRTNSKVMINQMKGLRAAMGEDSAEFIFVDAPFLADGPTDPVIERVHGKDAPFYEWWYSKAAENVAENETNWTWSLDNYDDAIAFMLGKLNEIGPVDVVVGFSQGSTFLTALSTLILQTKNELPWKLCVCFAGVAVGGIEFRDRMETPDGRPILVPFPSIHVIGRSDPICHKSIRLADQFDNHPTMFPMSPLKKTVLFHDEGHRFPSPHKHAELYKELARQIHDHCRACEDHEGSSQIYHALARL